MDCFFIDLTPSDVSVSTIDSADPPPESPQEHIPPLAPEVTQEAQSLLLPFHVSVSSSNENVVALENLQPSANLEANDYIEYLDYDDHKAWLFVLPVPGYHAELFCRRPG
jgi:hypothetical protein